LVRRWLRANLVKFEELGVFLEKYNVVNVKEDPVEGLYPSQVGFGWTNSVFLRFVDYYLEPQERPMKVMSAGEVARDAQILKPKRQIS